MGRFTARAPALALCLIIAQPASAQPSDGMRGSLGEGQVGEAQSSDQPSANQPSIRSSLGDLADPGGLRGSIEERGLSYSLTYIGEVLGNVSGGTRRGAVYEGRLDLQLDADLGKLAGWSGAALHANLYFIHGRGLSRDNLSNLLVASAIEALPSERLYELWFEQSLLDDRLGLRVGQLAADTEFIVSQTAGLFVNSTFGWPAITAANLPSGGPAYPLATPGIRVKLAPTAETQILLGAFNGDPAGPARRFDDPDPQRRNRNGTAFRLRDPAFLIAEGAWSYGDAKDEASFPGTVKLGYWHHLGRFNDGRTDALGLSLADPNSAGTGRRYRGNDGVYGIVDQAVYRVPGSTDAGVGVFARLSGSPADRNTIDLYADAGVAAKGMIPGRPDDTAGISVAYARFSPRLRGLDLDTALLSGTPGPLRSAETLIEVTYQAQVVPGFTIQPDFQYVFRPSGGIADPRSPTGSRIRDAAILGLRTSVRY